MKYKVLAVSTGNVINLGDYIQALAAAQFYPHIDGFVEREEIRDYIEEPCRMIMNGWYQSDPYQWPPSDKIDPLFVSVNFSRTAKWKLLDKKGLEYLKKHEPIGCRDLTTQDTLLKRNIDADFSACLTLTFCHKYATSENDGQVYFVDPFFETKKDVKSKLQNTAYLMSHLGAIQTIAKKYPDGISGTDKLLKIASFHREYSKVFTEDTLLNANYICLMSPKWKKDYCTNEELLGAAEQFVRSMGKAALVVTSRIQCALPCLSLETPVIFTELHRPPTDSSCYFSGLQELFTTMEWDHDHFITDFSLNGKISATDNLPKNKDLWQPLAQKLIKRCLDWVNKKSNE